MANIDFAHLKSVLQYLHVTVSPPKCQAFKYDFYTYSLHKPGKIVFFFGFHFPICKRVNNVATTEHIVKCTEKITVIRCSGRGKSVLGYISLPPDTSAHPPFWYTDPCLVLELQVFTYYKMTFSCED